MEGLKNIVETHEKSTDTQTDTDLEIDNLKCKIKKLEEDAHKTKLELEDQVKEYSNKLADRDAAYDIIEKKLREAELSLSEEHIRVKSENVDFQNKCPKCDQLMLELEIAQQENSTHLTIIEELEKTKKHLLNEQQKVRQELRLLLDLAEELQKKIESHKTNLSILTAVYEEENRTVKLLVKDLQHNNSRPHRMSSEDLPEINAQSTPISKSQIKYFKRLSLPDNTYYDHSKSESLLERDLELMNTNATLTTSDNNAVVSNQSGIDLTQNIILQNNVVGSFHGTDLSERNNRQNNSYTLKCDSINHIIMQNTEILKDEIFKIKQLADKLQKSSHNLEFAGTTILHSNEEFFSRKCNSANRILIDELSLCQLKADKDNFKRKYMDLLSEKHSVDMFLYKLTKLEQDVSTKVDQHDNKLSELLNMKNNEFKSLQTKNDELSKQIIKNDAGIEDTNKILNKISKLKNEVYASREDCKVLLEDVAAIKQYLNSSHAQDTKSIMSEIEEKSHEHAYELDKADCYNYYLEITGTEKEKLPKDQKMLDVMKMFYLNLVAIHGNEVENLMNKIKDSEEARINMQLHIDKMFLEYTSINQTMQVKENDLIRVSKLINSLKHNITEINKRNFDSATNGEAYKEIASILKNDIISMLDSEFGISIGEVFDVILNKYDEDLRNIEIQCTSLQSQKDILTDTLEIANRDLDEMKKILVDWEREYNLLKAQEAKMREINSAITLDISKKEQELNNIIRSSSVKLLQLNIMTSNDLILSESANQNINILLNCILNQQEIFVEKQKKIDNEISLKAKQFDACLVDKSKELDALKSEIETLKQINDKITLELTDKDDRITNMETMYHDLRISYIAKVQENIENLNILDKLKKESADSQSFNTMRHLKEDNEKLLSLNVMILNENKTYAMDLQKADETITQNNKELAKMKSDIRLLQESVKEATGMIESLKKEVHDLTLDNTELKQQIEAMYSDCSRLETNIKTSENTVEIQEKMIIRLQTEKEKDNKLISEKQTKIEELRQSYFKLQKAAELLSDVVTSSQEKLTELKGQINYVLEDQVEGMKEHLRRIDNTIH